MVKRPLLLISLLAITCTLTAQQSWEGLATVSRFGRFPAGLFGASNLVPPNSLVSIRNLETGLSERIIITDSVEDPGVFLVLSPESAALLDVSGSGATRVRLTTIVSAATVADVGSEQPFHPDPDINPSAGVALEIILPEAVIPPDEEAAAAEPEEVIEPADAPIEDEAVVEVEIEETAEDEVVAEADEESADQVAEVFDEEAPAEAVGEPPDLSEQIEPSEEAGAPLTTPIPRSGIAAGVARMRVGQAQQSFERPETALVAGRPGPMPDALHAIGEPEIQPREIARFGIASLSRVEEIISPISLQPEPTIEEAPLIEDTFVEDSPSDESTADAVEVVEPIPVDEDRDLPNPIQDAVASAVRRIPARDFFPPAVGEESDLGFVGLMRPVDAEEIDVALAETKVPKVDRPELAGLAPLQALPKGLPESLAEASLPPEDLPAAAIVSEERPIVQDLPRHSAPGESLTSGALAEAEVAPTERPISDFVVGVIPPVESVLPLLADPAVADSERPTLADIEPAAVAEIASETPELRLGAEEPLVVDESIAILADIPADALLTLEPADFRPPEYPGPDQASLIDRKVADESPELVAVLEAPISPESSDDFERIEEGEATDSVVEDTEPAPVVVVPELGAEVAISDLPIVSTLAADNYYLQIGAYAAAGTAQVAIDALGATYPIAVLPIESRGTTVYRVLVGPLEQDETGTLLLWLRAKGFRDTFIRSGVEL